MKYVSAGTTSGPHSCRLDAATGGPKRESRISRRCCQAKSPLGMRNASARSARDGSGGALTTRFGHEAPPAIGVAWRVAEAATIVMLLLIEGAPAHCVARGTP